MDTKTPLEYQIEVEVLPDSYRVYQPPGSWVGPCPWKPIAIQKKLLEMKQSGQDDLLVWIDGDVVILQNFDEVNTGNYPFAVTMRPDPIDWFRKINTGVLFFYPCKESFDLLEDWINAVPGAEYTSDQYALNCVLKYSNYSYTKFPAEIYNFTEWDDLPKQKVKLAHCLTQYRAKAVEWVKYGHSNTVLNH